MLKILSSSLIYGENFNQEINFGDANTQQKQKESTSIEFSTLPSSVLNYITTALNTTFFNSDAEYRNNKILNETLNKISNEFEIFQNKQNFSFKDNLKMLPPAPSSLTTYQESPAAADEQTEIVQNILRDVTNDEIDNVYVNDDHDNIGSVIKSSINFGYSTVLNLMNSLADVSTLPPTINIALSLSPNDSSNSLDSTTISSFNEIENLNHSYYHHLPPSLLNGHQFSVADIGSSTYASQLTGNINSISNADNGIPLVGGSSSSSEVGLVVASYINSTMLNNLSTFLLNNSTDDEQYLIKMNGNNHELEGSGSGDESIDQFASGGAKRDFVFDRTDVKIIFITLYSLVFCCCFFGNLLVILVVTLSRRLRSITNFFLANLAVADFCVGVFCVMQNLTIYLIDSWVFGKFLCKMYQFVHSLSYTASIFILVVICMERYFAIIHPITCKQILTPSRLRLVILGVWITSAVYSTPKFIFSKTITNIHTINGIEEHICILDRQMFNSELLDLINFGFLYVTPLLVMTILYSRIAIALWKSSRGLERHIALQSTSTCSPSYSGAQLHRKPSSMKYENQPKGGGVAVTESQVSIEADKVIVTTWKKSNSFHQRHGTQVAQISNSTNNVLRARRGVIRMLIIVVLTFALCNLPFHARKMWMYWSDTYKGYSNFNALFTPLTFLATYFNSGVNPLLYAFLSRNFRKGMRELLLCSFRKNKNKSLSMHQRVPLQEVANVVMQVVNLPLEKIKEQNSNSSDLTNQHKSLQQEDSIKEQQTEIVSTEEL